MVKTWTKIASREGWLAKLSRWYEQDWQNAIVAVSRGQTQPPPDASDFIALLPEEKRELALSTVRSIDQYYRETYQSASSHRRPSDANSQMTAAVYADSVGSEHPTLDADGNDFSADQFAKGVTDQRSGAVDVPTLDTPFPPEAHPQATGPQAAGFSAAIDQPTLDSDAASPAAKPADRGTRDGSSAADVETGEFSFGDAVKSPSVRRGRRTLGQTVGNSSSEPKINLRVGDMLGDHRVERVLGRGGMGIVFLARQVKLDRLVALKMILSANDTIGNSQLARFEAEAKAIAKFQHENIVRIFETGKHDNMPYFSLEYIEGESLAELMRDGPLEFDEAARIAGEIGRGIHYAHGRGIVHRDLKPANVLLTLDATAKVTDFGLAKEVESDQSLSVDGAVVGTPGFMAPEQVTQSHPIGPATDVWGLGSVLYAMLTGQPPFLGANRGESMMMLIQQEPLRPSRVRGGIPIDLETICLKCLEKDPDKRYESAEAVVKDLDRFRRGEPITARAITRRERAWRWCRRNPTIAVPSAAAAALAMVMAVGGPITAGTIYRQAQQVTETNTRLAASEQEARANEKVAVRNERLAEQARLQALENEKKANESEKASEVALKNATDALQVVVFKTLRELQDRPGMSGVRNSLLETAKTQLGLTDNSIDPEKQTSLVVARVLISMGEMNIEAGRTRAALASYQKCLRVVEKLDERGELSQSSRLHNLSKAQQRVGDAALGLGNLQLAEKHFQAALLLRRQWIAERPDDPGVAAQLAGTLGALGTTAKYLGDYEQAKTYLDESLELRRRVAARRDDSLFAAMEVLGAERALVLLDDVRFGPDHAIEAMKKVVDDFGELAGREVGTMVVRANAALAANQLAVMHLAAGRNTAAVESFGKAVELFSEVLKETPERSDLRPMLADALEGILIAETRMGRPLDDDRLKPLADRLRDLREEMFDLDPYNDRRRYALIGSLVRLEDYQRALEIARDFSEPKTIDDDLWLASAGALALLAGIPESKIETPSAGGDGPTLRREFADRAIKILETGLRLGRLQTSQVDRSFDLAAIRTRPDFAKLTTNAVGAKDPTATSQAD